MSAAFCGETPMARTACLMCIHGHVGRCRHKAVAAVIGYETETRVTHTEGVFGDVLVLHL